MAKMHFEMTTDKDVVNNTVKLIAAVAATVRPEQDDIQLRRDVHVALRQIVPREWNIGTVHRAPDASGLERVTLSASVRVDETENYALERRAADASRAGMKLSVTADTSLPLYALREAQSDMREKLIHALKDEVTRINMASGDDWYVQSIEFATDTNNMSGARGKMANAYAAASTSMMDVMGGDGFGRTEKLFMQANVTLKTKSS